MNRFFFLSHIRPNNNCLLVPTVPINLRVKPGPGEGSVIVEWEAPGTPNGDILHYDIRYWKSGEKQQFRPDRAFADNAKSTIHVIYGLEANNTYYVQVKHR